MNKLKMFSVAFMCACGLILTSCVDDEESQSVENIRNAKAEALKAKAALDNANAEAAKLLAQAEVALKNAEAAYQQAEADKAQAEVEEIKATLETEIEIAKLQAQAALDKAKQLALTAEASYNSELYARYSSAVNEVYSKTLDKIQAQQNLLNAKYKLENFDVLTANNAASYKQQIANAEARIAAYEQMSDADNDAIKEAYTEALTESTRLDRETKDAQKALNLAIENKKVAQAAFDHAAYAKAAGIFSDKGVQLERETYKKEETGKAADGKEFMVNDSYISSELMIFRYLLPVDEKEVAICINTQKAVLEAAKKAFADVDADYQKLQKKVDEAFYNYDTAKVAANKVRYFRDYSAAKEEAADYYSSNGYEQKLNAQEEAQKTLDELNAAKEVLTNYSAYQAVVDALKEEIDACVKAQLTCKIKDYEYDVAISRTNALFNSDSSIESLIAQEKMNIKNYNNQLAALSIYYNGDQVTEEGWETLVAHYEALVATLEGEIAKAQADADHYKSLMEAEA